jgi:hypothetical protein
MTDFNKTLLFFMFALLLNGDLLGQIDSVNCLKKELIGSWEFSELRDRDKKKVDTIKHMHGYELASGPLLKYNIDGTYSKQFRPANIDKGKWYFDNKTKSIVQMLYYTQPYGLVERLQIDGGQAKKDKNGDYYEIIIDYVIELTKEKLVILEEDQRQKIFKRKFE